MALTGDIIPVARQVRDASLPLPKIGYKEKDFKNRKQFLNARARAAGYTNYNQWLKARRSQGVAKKNKGGRRPSLFVIALQDYRLIEGGVDEISVDEINVESMDMSEKDAIRGLRELYDDYKRLSEEDKGKIYTALYCYKHTRMTIDEVKEYYSGSDNELVLAICRKDYLAQSAFLCAIKNESKNLDTFINSIEKYIKKEIIK